jgi:hypothetical protein
MLINPELEVEAVVIWLFKESAKIKADEWHAET